VKKRLKYSHAKVRRLKRKVKSLQEVVVDLRKKDLITPRCEAVLETTFSGIPLEVMKRIVRRQSSKPTREEYPDELKSFALTLAFYSLKAYKYVRKTFELAPQITCKRCINVDSRLTMVCVSLRTFSQRLYNVCKFHLV